MGIIRDFFSGPTQAPAVKAEPVISTQTIVPETKSASLNPRDMLMLLDPQGVGRLSTTYSFHRDAEEAVRNPVVQKCISSITLAAQQPRWELYVGDKEVEASTPALAGPWQFIQRPNEKQSLKKFIQEYLLHIYLAGEAFLELFPDPISFKRGVGKVYLISPHRIAFDKADYVIDGKRRVPMVNADGTRQILHIRGELNLFNSRGRSPLDAAWTSIVNHNSALRWNSSVLQNSAKLSLVAMMKTLPDNQAALTKEQLDDLNRDISRFSTPEGRSKPLVLSGDWDLEQFGMNHQELEWLKGMDSMSRNIALAFNLAPSMLALQGDATYNNVREANAALFEQTALPKLEEFIEELEGWFKEYVPGDWNIEINLDDVSALEVKREMLWGRADGKGVLSINERREIIGYEAAENGDAVPGTGEAPVTEEQPTDDDEEDQPKEPDTTEEGTNP